MTILIGDRFQQAVFARLFCLNPERYRLGFLLIDLSYVEAGVLCDTFGIEKLCHIKSQLLQLN